MFVSPNWIGLGAFGLLGLLNPGWWLIGAGLEGAYLLGLAGNKRFRRAIDAQASAGARESFAAQKERILSELPEQDRARYRALVQNLRPLVAGKDSTMGESLANLSWLYLQLLRMRASLIKLLRAARREDEAEGTMQSRISTLTRELSQPDLSTAIRTSLQQRLDLLQQRAAHQTECSEKLRHAEAELERIDEQASLLSEQAMVQREPAALSREIDRISSDVTGTSSWMREQRELFTEIESLGSSPPPEAIFETER